MYSTRTLHALRAALESAAREPKAARVVRDAVDREGVHPMLGVDGLMREATRFVGREPESDEDDGTDFPRTTDLEVRAVMARTLESALRRVVVRLAAERNAARALGALHESGMFDGLVQQFGWLLRRMQVDRRGGTGAARDPELEAAVSGRSGDVGGAA